DLNAAAQIQYGRIPELQNKLAAAQRELHGKPPGQRLLNEEVTEEDVAKVVSSWTGVPATRLLEGERQQLVKMKERLAQRVVGQREAITAVANAVRRARSGLQDPNRPIGGVDEGRLTDGQGRTVDFKNTLVIMTSNIGSPIIQEYFENRKLSPKSQAEMEDRVKTELKRHFRPEFLNRVDDIIIFHSLDEQQLAQIVEIQLKRLEKRLA